ncbi:hypothetical protein AAHE18_11G040700 [Arachis hypogaea]
MTSFWDSYKEFWSERFSFLSNYSNAIQRDKPLHPWTDSDVDQFIALDSVHGPARTPSRYTFQLEETTPCFLG